MWLHGGDGGRDPQALSLGSYRSTIELHPQRGAGRHLHRLAILNTRTLRRNRRGNYSAEIDSACTGASGQAAGKVGAGEGNRPTLPVKPRPTWSATIPRRGAVSDGSAVVTRRS